MKLVRPARIAPGVYQLRTIGVRVTAIFGESGVVLVDSGGRGSLGLISAGLKALDSSLEMVRLIVLTHYHPDHAGNLSKLVDATSAKVAVHRREVSIINGDEAVPSPYRHSLVAGLTKPFLSKLYGGPVAVDYPLEDGDSLPELDHVQAIHTPGHTSGSLCLYVAPHKTLIVGDALRHRFGRLGPPAASVTRDPAQAMKSLEKLLALDIDTICFGHYSPLRSAGRVASLLQQRGLNKATGSYSGGPTVPNGYWRSSGA